MIHLTPGEAGVAIIFLAIIAVETVFFFWAKK
jgi:hypothetical protein